MALTIEWLPTVHGPDLKTPVQLKHLKQAGGIWFWKALKSDHGVERMLIGQSHSSKRLLPRCDLLEQIQELRDKAIKDIVDPPADQDLGLDGEQPAKKLKVNLEKVPEIITVKAPSIGSVAGVPIKVLAGRPVDVPWIELSEAALNYIKSGIHEQINSGGIHKTRVTHQDISEPGVSFASSRGSWRVRRSDGTTKYFKEKDEAMKWRMDNE